YSFTGAITKPLEVLKGGYLSWLDLASGDWWQQLFFQDGPGFHKIGPLTAIGVSLRSQIDQQTGRAFLRTMQRRKKPRIKVLRPSDGNIGFTSERKANALRAQIQNLKEAAIASCEGPDQHKRRRQSRR